MSGVIVLISGVVWIAGSALVLLAPSLLASARAQVAAALSAGGLGALIALLGKSASTPAKEEASGAPAGKAGPGSRMTSVALSLAAPLFVVLVVLCLSTAVQHVLAKLPGAQPWPKPGDSCAQGAPAAASSQAVGKLHLEVAFGAPHPYTGLVIVAEGGAEQPALRAGAHGLSIPIGFTEAVAGVEAEIKPGPIHIGGRGIDWRLTR